MYIVHRPATVDRLHIWKNSNSHISVADHPIHSMFGSRVGFSGSADRITLFRVGPNSTGRPTCEGKKCARSN